MDCFYQPCLLDPRIIVVIVLFIDISVGGRIFSNVADCAVSINGNSTISKRNLRSVILNKEMLKFHLKYKSMAPKGILFESKSHDKYIFTELRIG